MKFLNFLSSGRDYRRLATWISRRLPQHLDRHAVFCRRLKNELGITGATFDFLAEVRTEFLEVVG
jgi:hypothetical protein